MRYVIGCDIGSQALKVILLSEEWEILGAEVAEYPIRFPQPAWAEQDVEHWWQAMAATIPRLYRRLKISPRDIVALGIDATVDGFVPVDMNGEPLAHYLLWMDRRSTLECDEISKLMEHKRLFALTGLNLDASHTAPKMLWLRNNRRSTFDRTWKFMPSASYAVFKLTGECVVDTSNASSTMLFDVQRRQWSKELTDLFNISSDRLPEIRKATDLAGHLTGEAADALGLTTNTKVVVGCGDEHAACLGAGALEPGIVVDVIGTAEPICTPITSPLFDNSQLIETHCHAYYERWLLENPGFVSGGNYRWFRDNFYGCPNVADYEMLNREAEKIPPGSEGIIFLPCMMGAMAPEWNDKARAVFYGLTLTHTRGHMARAILEGVAYALRSIIDRMRLMGCKIDEIRAVGGGSSSPLLRQIRADVTGIPVNFLSTTETTSLGAAILAAVGVGFCSSLEEAVARTTKIVGTTEPLDQNIAVYGHAYDNFMEIYYSLKGCFDKLIAPIAGRKDWPEN